MQSLLNNALAIAAGIIIGYAIGWYRGSSGLKSHGKLMFCVALALTIAAAVNTLVMALNLGA